MEQNNILILSIVAIVAVVGIVTVFLAVQNHAGLSQPVYDEQGNQVGEAMRFMTRTASSTLTTAKPDYVITSLTRKANTVSYSCGDVNNPPKTNSDGSTTCPSGTLCSGTLYTDSNGNITCIASNGEIISYTVKNQGTQSASASSTLRLQFPSPVDLTIPALKAGATYSGQYTENNCDISSIDGIADSTNAISESSETNNINSADSACAKAYVGLTEYTLILGIISVMTTIAS